MEVGKGTYPNKALMYLLKKLSTDLRKHLAARYKDIKLEQELF